MAKDRSHQSAAAKKRREAAEAAKALAEKEAAEAPVDPPTDTKAEPSPEPFEVVSGPLPPPGEVLALVTDDGDTEHPVTSGDLAKHMKTVQAVADEVAEEEEATMDVEIFCARARINPLAGFHAPSLTIIFGGKTFLLQKHIDLIIKGKAMLEAVVKQGMKYGLRGEHILIEEIDPASIYAGVDENPMGVVTLKSSQTGLKPA